MPTPSGRISRTASNTMHGTPIWWSVSAIASPPMPPPAINTGLFVTRWTDLHLDEFHYPLNDGGSKPAFDRRSDGAANIRYGSKLPRPPGAIMSVVPPKAAATIVDCGGS